jgi:iron complex transport system ATP-binding protein
MVVNAETMQPGRAAKHTDAVVFDAVSFAYAHSPVIYDVSLRVVAGEMVGLLGPNGAGKSTALKLATGVLKPQQGEIRLQGDSLRSLSRAEVARRVAVVPQDFSVQFAYTVRQIVEMGRLPHMGVWGVSRVDDRLAVQAALEATNVSPLADRVFNDLSGGERQRVLIALALAQDAPIILLDEPTAHLDIRHQIEVLDLLRRLNHEHGLTVIAALHDLNLAARYFPRLILFNREIVTDGPPASVLDEAVLSRVYQTPVQVGILRGEEHLSVLPPGYSMAERGEREREPSLAPGTYVHVVAGGGSGELLMRSLADAHIAFSAGPLNAGDSDATLAERLADLCIVEPPYAPVSEQGIASAREHMLNARAVIVCPIPLGHGNIALLQAALAARQAGVPVLLLEPTRNLAASDGQADASAGDDESAFAAIRARDFSGQGMELYRQLLAAGARWVATNAEAVSALSGSQAFL